jgi:hypothetical protein
MIGTIGTAIKLFGIGKSLAFGAIALVSLGTLSASGTTRLTSAAIGALADIAAEDATAIADATEMRKGWRACRERNGRWIQSGGKCQ